MSSQQTSVRRYLDRSSFERDDTQINTSSAVPITGGIRHGEVVTTKHNAKYKVQCEYDCSVDTTASNFMAELLVDGVVRDHVEESKDSAGTSVGGSGTDQRLPRPLSWVGDLTAGDHVIQLRFRPQTNGVEATMHYSHVTVERWI